MRRPTFESVASTQSPTPANAWAARPSMGTLARGRELQVEADVHVVAHPFGRGPVSLPEAVRQALQGRGALHPGSRARRRERESDRHGLLHAADREVARRAPAVARTLEA